MRLLEPNSVLNFGKNQGITIAEVFHFQPSYIEYLVMMHDDKVVDLEALEALPPPITIGYNPMHFSPDKPKLEFNEDNIFEILDSSDTVNSMLTVEGIRQAVESGFPVETLHGFKFPEFVKARNTEKGFNR